MKVLFPINLKGSKYDTKKTIVSTTDPVTIFNAPHGLFTTVKLNIHVVTTADMVAREILCIHNGTNAYHTEYAIVSTNDDSELMDDDFDSLINGNKININIEPSTATQRTVIVSVVSM